MTALLSPYGLPCSYWQVKILSTRVLHQLFEDMKNPLVDHCRSLTGK